MACSICTEQKSGPPVVCAKCSGTSCRGCFQQYLLNITLTPTCMHCRTGLSDDFVLDNTGLTWRTRVYKVYREQVLFDMELARMPETQPFAASYMAAKRIHTEAVNQWTVLKDYKKTVDLKDPVATQNARQALFRQSSLKNLMYPVIHLYGRRNGLPIDVEALAATAFMAEPGTLVPGVDHAAGFVAQAPKAFVMACPETDCRGFLDAAYKCGMCSATTCKACHELLGAGAHTCNPDSVASVKALKAEARPCPTCAAVISKIDGCDQMWCTQCKTTFSWRTGQVETGHTHNPHYYAYMRANGGLGRAPGDVGGGGCRGFPTLQLLLQQWYPSKRLAMRRLSEGWDMWIWMQRFPGQVRTWNVVAPIEPPSEGRNPLAEQPDLEHYIYALTQQHEKLGHLRRLVAPVADDNHDLRVMFMAKELGAEEFKVQLQRRDKAYRKNLAKFHIYDMVYTAGGDVLNNLIGTRGQQDELSLEDSRKAYEQIVHLMMYANTCLERLEKVYTCVADKYSLEPYVWRARYMGYL